MWSCTYTGRKSINHFIVQNNCPCTLIKIGPFEFQTEVQDLLFRSHYISNTIIKICWDGILAGLYRCENLRSLFVKEVEYSQDIFFTLEILSLIIWAK